MARSLQDQLLELGLATEDQLRNTQSKSKAGGRKKKPRNDSKRARNRKPQAAAPPAQPGRKRGKSNEPSAEEKALRQRVHKMIGDDHEPRGEDAQVPFHFVKGSRVKRIYVTEDQRQRLSTNELAVAAMKGRHYVIPMATAETIRTLIPPYFVSIGKERDGMDLTDVDDEYAAFQVPDDLMW